VAISVSNPELTFELHKGYKLCLLSGIYG
jgi:hypothetical protein